MCQAGLPTQGFSCQAKGTASPSCPGSTGSALEKHQDEGNHPGEGVLRVVQLKLTPRGRWINPSL